MTSSFRIVAIAVAATLTITSPLSADPDRKKRVSGQTVAELYSGKTWIWKRGGSHWGRDGSFEAIWKDSVGLGRWYATSKGNLCYEAVWYDAKDEEGEEIIRCWRHVTDSKGQLWKQNPMNEEWYKPNKEFSERMKPGNEISSQVRKLRRKYGV